MEKDNGTKRETKGYKLGVSKDKNCPYGLILQYLSPNTLNQASFWKHVQQAIFYASLTVNSSNSDAEYFPSEFLLKDKQIASGQKMKSIFIPGQSLNEEGKTSEQLSSPYRWLA